MKSLTISTNENILPRMKWKSTKIQVCSFRKFILKLSFMCKGNSKPVLVCKGSENKPSTQTSGKKKLSTNWKINLINSKWRSVTLKRMADLYSLSLHTKFWNLVEWGINPVDSECWRQNLASQATRLSLTSTREDLSWAMYFTTISQIDLRQ